MVLPRLTDRHPLGRLAGPMPTQRTLVIVAHRLATVADADQILVLDDGRITAVGTHRELLDRSPLYRELAEHQLLV